MKRRIGQRYFAYYNGELRASQGVDRDEYILAQVNMYEVTLINLRSGNRWVEPVTVLSAQRITEEDWGMICSISDTRVRWEINTLSLLTQDN